MEISYMFVVIISAICIVLAFCLGKSEYENKSLKDDLRCSKELATIWFHAYNGIRKGVEKNRTLCDLEKEEIIYPHKNKK